MSILRGLLIVAVASSALVAQGRGRGGGDEKSQQEKSQAPKPQPRTKYTAKDRDSDSRVIVSWFSAHPDSRPGPGRARGRGHAIAPGWQKHIVRSAPIPVVYREYIEPVPVVLVQMLPPVRSGWEFVVIENQVLLIDRPTWTVIDIVIKF